MRIKTAPHKLASQRNKQYIVQVFPAWLWLDTFSEQAGFALKKKKERAIKIIALSFFREIEKRCPFFNSQFVALEP